MPLSCTFIRASQRKWLSLVHSFVTHRESDSLIIVTHRGSESLLYINLWLNSCGSHRGSDSFLYIKSWLTEEVNFSGALMRDSQRKWLSHVFFSLSLVCFCHERNTGLTVKDMYFSLMCFSFFPSFVFVTNEIHVSLSKTYTAYCIWCVIQSQSPISISLVSFQRNVVKET